MKRVMIIAAGLLLASTFSLNAQSSQEAPTDADNPELTELPVPDYNNTVVYFDSSTNEISSLEITRSETVNKGSGLSVLPIGVGGGKTNVMLRGGASPVVLPTGAQFIVKLADPEGDPNSWVMLYELEQKIKRNPAKSRRYMTTSKTTGVSISVFNNTGTKSVSGESQQILHFQRIRPGVHLATPVSPLPPGEYFFTIIDPNAMQAVSPMVYAFGVQ